MAVNGHAVGIGCTMTQLGDIAYCSDAASFEVPFMKLGFCAEGCSSVLFPEILGQSKGSMHLLSQSCHGHIQLSVCITQSLILFIRMCRILPVGALISSQ